MQTQTQPVRRISVIVPLYNEADHIDALIADLDAQDYDGDVEVLVADGGSTDGSIPRLTQAARKAGIDVTILENRARWVSAGLNVCLERASGDLIVRLDCHSRYPPDYLRRCATAAEETGAWNVGGVVVPRGRTAMERAVACAMDSPFGGIGWTRHNSREERIEVDTVTYGAFRPEAFERAGGFDESLIRNQDDELNARLRAVGGRIVLDPAIRVQYIPRGSFRGVFRQYSEYGFWKVPVMLKHRSVLSLRSLAPAVFVASLAGLAALAPRNSTALKVLAAELGAYGALAVVFGASSVKARGDEWRLVPRTTAVFPAFHVGYGIGMLRGWLRAALS